MTPAYRERRVDFLLRELLATHPAVMLHGPRASGKTTTGAQLAASAVRFDVRAEAAIFRADPDAALAAHTNRPLLIDEWQEVPEIMGAVKRAVDAGARPGSFLLTGSVRAAADGATWPGTGRVLDVQIGALTERELRGANDGPDFLDHVERGFISGPVANAPTVVDYLDLALRGGFPEPALAMPASEAGRWYANYIEQTTRRDAITLLRRADPDRLRRYVEAYALTSAGVVDHSTIFDAAGVNRKTAEGYEAILERLFLVAPVPPWWSNRLKRLTRRPKSFMADPALMVAAARLDRESILRDGTLIGRVIEAFVYSQLRGEIVRRRPAVHIHHLRTEGGREEIDLVLDLGAGRIVGVEVKAAASVEARDARHLAWLRDRLGDDFVLGAVLHTGPSIYPLGDRIVAVPICVLWTP